MNITLTFAFTVITVLMTIAAWNNESLLKNWIMNPRQVSEGHEYYRFITSGFIHADWMHLIFNMFTFFSFGSHLEDIFEELFGSMGGIYFAFLYLAAIIVSDIPTYLKHKHDGAYNSLGASGGVSAILFATILFNPTGTILVYGFEMSNIIYAILFFIYSVYQMKQGTDNVNHSAHLWGAAFGIIFVLIIFPPVAQIFWDDLRAWHLFN